MMLQAKKHPSKIHMLNSEPQILQNMTVFGNRAFKEEIKAKWGLAGPNPIGLVLLKEKDTRTQTSMHRGKTM